MKYQEQWKAINALPVNGCLPIRDLLNPRSFVINVSMAAARGKIAGTFRTVIFGQTVYVLKVADEHIPANQGRKAA